MFIENDYPILEFDTAADGIIRPSALHDVDLRADKMVITFFPEVVEMLLEEGKIALRTVISGENPIRVYAFTDEPDVILILGFVGCPACAGNLDFFNAKGIQKVMFCGGGGVLDKNIDVGRILVVDSAIRDEGFSYHYLKPSRYVFTDKKVVQTITQYLSERGIPYITGRTWTTDALFRETPERIAHRREEGAKIVEMEQAGCLAVAQCRGFAYGAVIYAGDDVSQSEWSNRSWRTHRSIRYDLVMLCKKLVNLT